jgi:hypothetical protein
MIVACQVMDPGSIPGERNYPFLVFGCFSFAESVATKRESGQPESNQ